jgi:hypothetical protein
MSKWDDWKISSGATRPWHLLNPNQYSEEEGLARKRLLICQGCPQFINLTTQCKKCGCIMSLKTKLEAATCPLGKW